MIKHYFEERPEVFGKREEDDLRPHAVPFMSTPIGRLIERLGYGRLTLMALFTLLLATVYYVCAPEGHGIVTRDVGDALFFSIVSFTSLGYGDLLPEGFGRVVASALVISGLAITALTIGKVASERQSALLLLLHTSDIQRRLAGFTQQLREASEGIVQPEPARARHLKLTSDLVQAVRGYISFNAFQASAATFGNFTALSMLYDVLGDLFDNCIDASKNGRTPETLRRALTTARGIQQLVNLMSRLHSKNSQGDKPIGRGSSRRLRTEAAAATKAHKQRARMSSELDTASESQAKGFNPIQVEHVFEAMPVGTAWPTGIHKQIASNLGISASVATQCITELKRNGRLPKL